MTDEHKSFCTPAMARLIVGTATLLLSGAAAVVYTPLRSGLDSVTREVAELKSDPHPKPETRVELDGFRARFDAIEAHHNRLEDRVNGLHFYIMQNPPKQPVNSPFSRRGDAVIPMIEMGRGMGRGVN